MVMGGKLIVFEGIDASGKATQARLLKEKLESLGFKVALFEAPDYSTPVGKLIRKYLKKEIEIPKTCVPLLYAADRAQFAEKVKRLLEDGYIVIYDRYSYSNVAYQLDFPPKWLLTLDSLLKNPDLVIFLDIPVEESLKRKREHDRYEEKKEFLERVRQRYLAMLSGEIETGTKWIRIDGVGSIEEVHGRIWEKIKEIFGQ